MVGFAARVGVAVLVHVKPAFTYAEMEQIARSLALHNLFGDPYKIPTGPTAHHAPAYPFLLSLIFRTMGFGSEGAKAMITMNLLFASAQYALLPAFAEASQLPRLVGLTAGLMGALAPFRILKEVRWEASLIGLCVVTIAFLTILWWNQPHPSMARSAFTGFAWGVSFLIAPVLLPAFLLMLVLFAYDALKGHRRGWAAPAAVVIAMAVVTILPWTIRNYLQLGGWIFVRSNFGLEFSISNCDEAHALSKDNIVNVPGNYFHLRHPWANANEAALVREEGELAYNRASLHSALEWCRTHPSRFLSVTLQRMYQFWALPSYGQRYKDVILEPITILAFIGLFLLVRRRQIAGLVMLAIWSGFPLVYYLVQADSRYRYPLDWSFLLLACVTLWAVYQRVFQSPVRERELTLRA
jgi:hypothetical protein